MSNAVITDYETLIDAQTRAFIKLTDNWYPPNTIDFSLQQQREIYNNMCQQFHRGYPDGVSAGDATIPTDEYVIPVRRYTSTSKQPGSSNQADSSNQPDSSNQQCVLIIYFHGGGFIVGGLDSHDDICAELCSATGFDVTAVDYRLAPEHLHPAAFNDSLASVIHESNRANVPVVLCGDSAGGNLAAAVSHAIRDSEQNTNVVIAGQVLIYPGLGGDTSKGSYITHANAPMLTTREVNFYSNIRTGSGKNDQSITTHSPLQDTDFTGLPDTFAFSAECDPLADDSKHYTEAIKNAGGNAKWFNEEGLVHGYLRARSTVDRAKDSFDRIIEALIKIAASQPL